MLDISCPTQDISYELNHAILFYQRGGDTIATFHKVEKRKLLAGKSLAASDLEELFHSENQKQKMTFMPPEVIAWSRNEVIWFEPSRLRPIYFNVPEKKRQFLNELSGKNVLWPSLVFRIRQQNLCCWAVKGKKRPDLNAELYNPPFTNIFSDYRFCAPPEMHNLNFKNIIDYAENAIDIFFRGHFSHLNGRPFKTISFRGGLDRFWQKIVRDCENGMCRRFPDKHLVKANRTLRGILS